MNTWVSVKESNDGSMKQILHSWSTPWGSVRLVDGPRPAGMGVEHWNLTNQEWQPCSPLDQMFTKEILRLLCEVRRLSALYDGEKQLRRDTAAIPPAGSCGCPDSFAAADWYQRYENLAAMWRLIGDSLNAHGYTKRGDSSDVWPARVEGLLKEVEALRDRENQFAQILKDRESSTQHMLKERADQTNHAIRVNREEAGQAGYDRSLADIATSEAARYVAEAERLTLAKCVLSFAQSERFHAEAIVLAARVSKGESDNGS